MKKQVKIVHEKCNSKTIIGVINLMVNRTLSKCVRIMKNTNEQSNQIITLGFKKSIKFQTKSRSKRFHYNN